MADDAASEAVHLRSLGQLLAAQARFDLAQVALERAQTNQAARGDLAGLALTLRVMAAARRKQGEHADAEALDADAARYERF